MENVEAPRAQSRGRELLPSVIRGERVGEITLGDPLGSGSTATVRRGKTEFGRPVAVKELQRPPTLSPGASYDPRVEGEIHEKLSHPHIVPAKLDTTADERNFLIMPVAEGSLRDLLSQSGKLPPEEVIRLGFQVGAALAEMHEGNVVHNDLKPGNIFWETGSRTGKPFYQVGDFGTAIDLNTGIRTTDEIQGTFPYMSLERFEWKKENPLDDMYAFGLILREAATGERVIQGKIPDQIYEFLTSSSEFKPISYFIPEGEYTEFHAVLEVVTARAIHRDPDMRYPNMGVLLDDLRGRLAVEKEKRLRRFIPPFLIKTHKSVDRPSRHRAEPVPAPPQSEDAGDMIPSPRNPVAVQIPSSKNVPQEVPIAQSDQPVEPPIPQQRQARHARPVSRWRRTATAVTAAAAAGLAALGGIRLMRSGDSEERPVADGQRIIHQEQPPVIQNPGNLPPVQEVSDKFPESPKREIRSQIVQTPTASSSREIPVVEVVAKEKTNTSPTAVPSSEPTIDNNPKPTSSPTNPAELSIGPSPSPTQSP